LVSSPVLWETSHTPSDPDHLLELLHDLGLEAQVVARGMNISRQRFYDLVGGSETQRGRVRDGIIALVRAEAQASYGRGQALALAAERLARGSDASGN
jgi:hypothetical protein